MREDGEPEEDRREQHDPHLTGVRQRRQDDPCQQHRERQHEQSKGPVPVVPENLTMGRHDRGNRRNLLEDTHTWLRAEGLA